MRASATHSSKILALPLILQIWLGFSVAMFLPAALGWAQGDYVSGRAFLYSGFIGILGVWLSALAMGQRGRNRGALTPLLALFCALAILPVFLTIPVVDALNTRDFVTGYVDMVGAVTTTGAQMRSPAASVLPDAIHLWRALVGWLGGLMIWIAASAILAPLSLGGFEITTRGEVGHAARAPDQSRAISAPQRIHKHAVALAPVYFGLTISVAILLLVAGEDGFIAICHAMSVMATSGISPVGGVEHGVSGRGGEAILFLFMAFALSRLTFSSDTVQAGGGRLDKDPEFRVGVVIVLGVTAILFARHWLAAYDMGVEENLSIAFDAFWGGLFTAMSFLTTTGFVSDNWDEIRDWSGLGSPGMILMGLAVMGGGVATTAGGVKLLRVWALYLNGLREMERLVHPSAVRPLNRKDARIHRNGATLAWVAFMLFALSLAFLTVGFAAVGVAFEDALILAISGLTTTGPLVEAATDDGMRMATLSPAGKMLYALAMVVGRMETLALVALLTPDLWRN